MISNNMLLSTLGKSTWTDNQNELNKDHYSFKKKHTHFVSIQNLKKDFLSYIEKETKIQSTCIHLTLPDKKILRLANL